MFSEIDNKWKLQFPTLNNNTSLAYFDSAASTQTHQSVLDRMNKYYEYERCNVNRGDFKISMKVSDDIETARQQFAELIGTQSNNILFTKGASDGINMIAEWMKDVPVVIITEAEHSSNILPWITQGRTVKNGKLVVVPLTETGQVNIEEFEKTCKHNPMAFCSLIGTSNVTGISLPIKAMTEIAHSNGLKVAVDYCQTIGSKKISLGSVDFAVFSGHKMYGPTGIGTLYSRIGFEHFRPIQFGGGQVEHYDFDGNIKMYEGVAKHEVGTPNIAGILGLGIASEWINFIGYDTIQKRLTDIALCLSDKGLFNISGLELIYKDYGHHQRNVYSFVCRGFHPGDISPFLGFDNVAVRVGKLCAHPYVRKFSDKGVLRVSTGIYNTEADCEQLVKSLCKAIQKVQ